MRIIYRNLKMLLFFVSILIYSMSYAQQKTVTGKVIDESTNEPLPGVSIVVVGTTNGTVTDVNGEYSLNVDQGQTLSFSFIGYITKQVLIGSESTVNVALAIDTEQLEEVVVIGYGTVKKEDATGSVSAINSDDFNVGLITSPQELVSGKIAGVQITNAGGAPGAGATIRIRGGSSLSASNDPLIVIDGVPVDNDGISGMRNPLSAIHPSDIETFTVLKDASATAIYGSRASNGVIIITTKKGKKGLPMRITYNGNVSVSMNTSQADVFDANGFRNLLSERYGSGSAAVALLGDANTNWQDEIYREAISHDHNLSITGSVADQPYRASVGFTDQQGVLLHSGLNRYTGSVGLNPTFFDGLLSINANFKGMYIHNNFSNQGAIGAAVSFDPTQPIYDDTSPYGGYFTWKNVDGSPNTRSGYNPVAMLDPKFTDDQSNVYRGIGNLQVDYKFHFLPDLRANLNLGADYSTSDGSSFTPEDAPWSYDPVNGGGNDHTYTQDKKNELLDFYLNYVKEIDVLNSRVDVMAGYSWQHFWRAGTDYSQNVSGSLVYGDTDYETESYLVSFFGRLNYSFMDKYLLTFTLRQDGSSRFSPDTRWGTFPSAAFAWKMKEETFLKNSNVISDMKLRLGYGITGQQNIGNDYPYLPNYTYSEPTADIQFGNNFVKTLRPEGYDANIKWEETTTYNIGLDYGLFNNRINGTFDAYLRKTNDLINFIPVPAGTNLTNYILTNVGDLENKGVEFSINSMIISQQDLSWEVGFNITYNKNKITKLTSIDDPDYIGVQTGGFSGGVGNTIQIHSVGYPAGSFFVYRQIFDENGMPIEGLYEDTSRDGIITNDDRYRYKKAAPDVFMGLSTRLNYKNWDFSASARINLGNYVYNNRWSGTSYSNLYDSSGSLRNISTSIEKAPFENPKYFSDFFVREASFGRLDNVNLGYTFKNAFEDKLNIRVFGSAQNVIVITNYEGLDPEVADGIDNNIYPRPTVFMLGVSIDY
ncbi:MAG: TonB-dependent receptor [Prolixibacteraceae bacterium]|nr:TonB-dependent receptor [Prolixibacteraceae bacterium]